MHITYLFIKSTLHSTSCVFLLLQYLKHYLRRIETSHRKSLSQPSFYGESVESTINIHALSFYSVKHQRSKVDYFQYTSSNRGISGRQPTSMFNWVHVPKTEDEISHLYDFFIPTCLFLPRSWRKILTSVLQSTRL